MVAGWANMTMDKETDGKVEKVYKDGARTMHEEYRKDGSRGEATVILANGVIVEAEGDHVDIDTLKKVLASVDLGKIEAMMKSGEFEALYKKRFQSPIPPKGINLNAPMSKELDDN